MVRSAVRFGEPVQIGEVKFLPIDCRGVQRFFGKELLVSMSETFSRNEGALDMTQRATARALKFVIENDFSDELCGDTQQISMIQEWVSHNDSRTQSGTSEV